MTPDDIKRDMAVLAAATKGPWKWWTSNSHNRLRRPDGGPDIAYGTKLHDGVDHIVISDPDMLAIETAVNRLPEYIAEVEEMRRRIDAIDAAARGADAAYNAVHPEDE